MSRLEKMKIELGKKKGKMFFDTNFQRVVEGSCTKYLGPDQRIRIEIAENFNDMLFFYRISIDPDLESSFLVKIKFYVLEGPNHSAGLEILEIN